MTTKSKPTRALETWSDTLASWRAAYEALIERFRPLYLAELERFAETLRPRFEAGELRGMTEEDLGVKMGANSPLYRCEDLCAEHFGLEVDDSQVERAPATADLIIAVSPSADAADPGGGTPSQHAAAACAWDVIAIARTRGWYRADPDECPSEETTRWAQEVRS